VRVRRATSPELVFETSDGCLHHARVVSDTLRHYVRLGASEVRLDEEPRFPNHREHETEGACVAPMPGKIVKLDAKEGAHVTRGAPLVVLEAMKMEHTISAPYDGTIARVLVRAGDQVDAEMPLVVVTRDG
jgi:biotin carboxyl carrier protein